MRYIEKQTFATTFLANIIGIEYNNLSNKTIRGPFYKAKSTWVSKRVLSFEVVLRNRNSYREGWHML